MHFSTGKLVHIDRNKNYMPITKAARDFMIELMAAGDRGDD